MKPEQPSQYTPLPKKGSEWCGIKQADPKPILYFSGVRKFGKFGAIDVVFKRVQWQHRCLSYYYLVNGKNGEIHQEFAACKQYGTRILLDSGAHTFLSHRKAHKGDLNLNSYLEKYAEFVKKNRQHFDFYVNFDYVKKAPEVYRVHGILNELGIRPVPVYHGDSELDWLRRYADSGHKLIGLGKPTTFMAGNAKLRRNYYDHVFHLADKLGMKCHGFAVTGRSMFLYPWHSVDSTSWLMLGLFGKICFYNPTKRTFDIYHVSTEEAAKPGTKGFDGLSKPVQQALIHRVEAHGGNFKKLRQHSFYRVIFNAQQFKNAATPDASTFRGGWQPQF